MGPDELRARQLLLDMQDRLGRDPFAALGLNSSDPAEVRAAFLQLTKIYHPARFARMAVEIQRLANEVFLALRATHDSMVRPQIKPPGVRATGMIPVFRPPPAAAPAAPGRPATGPIPVLRPTPTPTPTVTPTARPGSAPVIARPPTGRTPALGTPITPARTITRPGSQPVQAPPSLRPTPQPPAQPVRSTRRLPSQSPPTTTNSPPARPTGATPAINGGDAEVAAIEQLLAQDRLIDARMKLDALIARQPGVPRYQALIHYAKGREAQLAGRRDEARHQLLDALELDRDLQLANTALGELLTKRK